MSKKQNQDQEHASPVPAFDFTLTVLHTSVKVCLDSRLCMVSQQLAHASSAYRRASLQGSKQTLAACFGWAKFEGGKVQKNSLDTRREFTFRVASVSCVTFISSDNNMTF